jgi:hypothetical protein
MTNLEFWKNAQSKDEILEKMRHWKETKERPIWESISPCDKVTKAYWTLWNVIELKDGVLMKKFEDDVTEDITWQILVPHATKEEILKVMHNTPTAGHLGENKTLESLKKRFYWFGMKEDVSSWIRSCGPCSMRKKSRNNKSAMKQYNVGLPMERVALDILGPLPRTAKGNKYILVVADYFSKWTEMYAMPNQEAVTITKKFVEEFICRFGIPQEIITDQGTQFESQLFKEICKMLDINKKRTTGFHPKANGMVERFNRTLESMLSMFVASNQKDWDVYLPLVGMAYRSTKHSSTEISPNMIMLGREIKMPVDIMYGLPEEDDYQDITEYVALMRKKLERVFQVSREKLHKASEYQKKMHDRRLHEQIFNKDDQVWLFTPLRTKGLSPKLQKHWDGPYKILKK